MPPPETSATLQSTKMVHWYPWTRDGEEFLVLKTPFNRDYVEALKAALPWDERRWAPELYSWVVHRNSLDVVISLLRRHFGRSFFCNDCFSMDRNDELTLHRGTDCNVWLDIETRKRGYEAGEEVRQREYLKTHPKKAKTPYGTPLVVSADSKEEAPAVSRTSRYNRSMDLE
jgi:hypothetical protein